MPNDELLTPLEAALIKRIETALSGAQTELSALRRHATFATLSLWLLVIFTIAALIDKTGGDSMKAAQAATIISHSIVPESRATSTTEQ